MKHLISLLPVFFFLGCTSTSMQYQNNTITLENKNNSYKFHGKTLYSSQQNLGRISIQQHVFSDTLNEILVYEYARLATGYKFKYNYQYILRHVFDAKDVELISDKHGLGQFTITLKDNTRLNALVKTGTKKSLTILYGFSEENFKSIRDESVLTQQKSKEVRAQEHIKSQWNVKLIITGVLLEQEGGKKAYYR